MFALYVAMASIAMMFAGLTSAYIVRRGQPNWRSYELPHIFWFSTVVIVLSSVTVHLALRALKARRIPVFRAFVVLSLVLGLCFGLLQYIGFSELYHAPKPVRLDGNPSESFLFIIWGLHLAHIAGGIVALLVVWLRSFRKNVKEYSATGMSIAANYWHFVDLLWLYLFIFFLVNQ
ncbi:cytochrome c oxidase subunit 3 [Rurimicrobium arvi]|uniref:Cytochrome c oxidase subunit 3 n=2 Tax=Rurimicrobium arvi TaxID=2049916 RepID=A0ABP8MPY4_9BACT